MEDTGIDFLLRQYIDTIVVEKTIAGLIVNRDDIERHLRDVSLYSVANNFIENSLERCEISNSKTNHRVGDYF